MYVLTRRGASAMFYTKSTSDADNLNKTGKRIPFLKGIWLKIYTKMLFASNNSYKSYKRGVLNFWMAVLAMQHNSGDYVHQSFL